MKTIKSICIYILSFLCIMLFIAKAADQKKISDQEERIETHLNYTLHQNHVIGQLKRIIETKEFAVSMFPNYPPENIYFGNLTISGDYTVVKDSLFICIGDFEYGININAANNVLVSDVSVESGYSGPNRIKDGPYDVRWWGAEPYNEPVENSFDIGLSGAPSLPGER